MSLESLGFRGLDSFQNPISFRWNLSTPWGISSQELCLEIPELVSATHDQVAAFGNRLWSSFIATAITSHCTLDFTEFVRWKGTPFVQIGVGGSTAIRIQGPAAPRDRSACIVMHTGHADSKARRQLIFPASPRNWQVDGVMTQEGIDGLYGLACGLFMGLQVITGSAPYSWLIAYPRTIEGTPDNLLGVAFRRVEYLRVLSYCAKAPDEVPLDWP